MSITLTPQLEADVLSRVSSGRYTDPMDVLSEALRLLDEQEKHLAYRMSIDESLAQIKRGEYVVSTPDLARHLIQESERDESLGVPMSADALP